MSDRAGTYTISGTGVRSFVPKPLPPDPPLRMTNELIGSLSRADRHLARLDGATQLLPNPDLFVYSFMRQEALLSSQIEGTQASLDDILEYEAGATRPERQDDVQEVLNYLAAMNWGLEELEDLPLSLRLIRGLHGKLLRTGRGSSRSPGEFRQTQNWIGDPGSEIQDAHYIPPAIPEMERSLAEWEAYLHDDSELPALVRCALIHAQFETIHPFLDGNGRLGRMIITFLLCSEGILQKPILYLSMFFRKFREDYYTHLQNIRDRGMWEEWVLFFLRGVSATSRSALVTARSIIDLHKETMRFAQTEIPSAKAPALAEAMFQNPSLTVTKAAELIGASYPTANGLVDRFMEADMLRLIPTVGRERVFVFEPYLDIIRHAEHLENLDDRD